MRVVWTAAAQDDLAEISDYIAADNPARAVSFINEIVDAGEAIADMPRAFPLVPQLEHRAVRRRIYGRYLIFFRIESEDLQILHVVHAARDYVRALFPED
jgi:plasmid stabilization system protein ParE